MDAPRRIVVGVDGSEDSGRALDWAVALVADRRVEGSDVEIIAVHVLGLVTHLGGTMLVPSEGHRGEVRTLLEHEWCRPLVTAGLAHRAIVVDGEPVHALMRVAKEQGADLIAVGRRGAGGSPGLIIGSTSQQLVHQAVCPVVVVPLESVAP
jgi:nucleotide-binding universal stress UspA family protein